MATIPNVEEIIYFIHKTILQSSSKDKQDFVNQKLSFESQNRRQQELLSEVINAFRPKANTEAAIWSNFNHWRDFNRKLENRVDVLGASSKSTVWVMLNFIYIPYLARQFAFWNYHEQVDEGMPGGKFWFLPDLDVETNEIVLPITSVLDWLMDLVGVKDIAKFSKCIADNSADNEKHESLIKNIRKAYTGQSEPHLNTIYRISEALKHIDFLDVFPDIGVEDRAGVTNDELIGRIDKVVEFMTRKGLSAEKLKHQIPLRPNEISKILEGKANKDDTISFIMHMHDRYKKPDPDNVRAILQIARASQLAFSEINKFFSKDKNDLFVNDGFINKSLQLSNMFKEIYNLTVMSMSKFSNEKNEFTHNKLERRFFRLVLEKKYPAEYLTLFKCIDQQTESVEMLSHLVSIVLSKECLANRSFFIMSDGIDRIHTTEGTLSTIFEKHEKIFRYSAAIAALIERNGDQFASQIYSETGWDYFYNLLPNMRRLNFFSFEIYILLAENSEKEADRLYFFNMLIAADSHIIYDVVKTSDLYARFTDEVLNNTLKFVRKINDARLEWLYYFNTGLHHLKKNDFKKSKDAFDQVLRFSYMQVPVFYKGLAAFCALAVYSSGFFKSSGFNLSSCKKYLLPVILYTDFFDIKTKIPYFCKSYIPENYDIDVAHVSEKAKEYFWEVLYKPYETVEYLFCPE